MASMTVFQQKITCKRGYIWPMLGSCIVGVKYGGIMIMRIVSGCWD